MMPDKLRRYYYQLLEADECSSLNGYTEHLRQTKELADRMAYDKETQNDKDKA